MSDTKPTEGVIAAVEEIAREYPGSFFALSNNLIIQHEVAEIIQHLAVAPVEKERDEQISVLQNELGHCSLRISNDSIAKKLLAEQRDKWRECAEMLHGLITNAFHKSNCSIQNSQEPRCDCGYEQELQHVLAEFERLKGEEK